MEVFEQGGKMKKLLVTFFVFWFATTQVFACAAITQKGTQCKRAPVPGSAYCWQHGGRKTETTASESSGNTSATFANDISAQNSVGQAASVSASNAESGVPKYLLMKILDANMDNAEKVKIIRLLCQ